MKNLAVYLFIFMILGSCSDTKERTFQSFDGVEVSYSVNGKGDPALIFVSGWGGKKDDFFYQIDYFSQSYQTVGIDLPGFGKSGNNRVEWTMINYAEDVIALMDQLKIDKAVLLGQSMGGIVILEVARKIPDRIIGVIPLDNIKDLEPTYTQEQLENEVNGWMDWANNPTYEKMKSIFSENTDSIIIANTVDDIKNASKVGWEEAITDVLQYLRLPNNLVNLLREIKVPIHCINKADTELDLSVARQYNPNITASSIENVGHFFLWDAPDESNLLIESAINEFMAMNNNNN
jgi:pimeloyl-ACP methyl ester carboxylesterase